MTPKKSHKKVMNDDCRDMIKIRDIVIPADWDEKGNIIDIHISTFINRLVEVKKIRAPFVSQFNEMFQIYQNSDPGTTTAQVALLQISYIVNKLLHSEFQISSTLASIQALRSSLSTVQRYNPCAKTSKK